MMQQRRATRLAYEAWLIILPYALGLASITVRDILPDIMPLLVRIAVFIAVFVFGVWFGRDVFLRVKNGEGG